MAIHAYHRRPSRRGHHSKHLGVLLSISFFVIFSIALLSRAELRLSGNILAEETSLEVLTKFGDIYEVELIEGTVDKRLYVLKGGEYDYLAEVVRTDGVWEVESVERLND